MLRDKQSIKLPEDVDKECIELCEILNRLPGIVTTESCCGHFNERFSIWFHCNDIYSLSVLGRATERNYSDGKWEVVVDSCDSEPYGLFWLRSKKKFSSQKTMDKSVKNLINSIEHWASPKFEKHFSKHDY